MVWRMLTDGCRDSPDGSLETASPAAPDDPVVVHPAWMEVDLDALAGNFQEVRRRVGPAIKIIGSVKGNGYGLGVAPVTRVLERLGAHAVATGSFRDAMAIRKAGLGVKVQMFPGHLPEGAAELLRHELIPSVYNLETAEAVSGAAATPAGVFVKVDGGLGRLGVPIEEAEEFVTRVARLRNIRIEGIFTHLPFSDAAGLEWARPRLERFDQLIARLKQAGIEPPVTQSVASAGVVCGVRTACNTVCTGHLLFGGVARVTPDLADLSPFRPVLKAVKARLIHVQHHPAGKTIGAGGRQFLRGGSTTGVIAVGLYDGYRPAAPGQTAMMLVRGQRVPVLYVTQEYTVIDLTGIARPRLGEEVILLGPDGEGGITIEEVGGWFGANPLQVLMSFNERFRCYYGGDRER